jgi:hypothetical protein
VDTGAVADGRERVAGMVAGLDTTGSTDPAALRWDGDQVGAGYGSLTEPVREALTLLARTEGIVLDPVYTGRAAAGSSVRSVAATSVPANGPSCCTAAACPACSGILTRRRSPADRTSCPTPGAVGENRTSTR